MESTVRKAITIAEACNQNIKPSLCKLSSPPCRLPHNTIDFSMVGKISENKSASQQEYLQIEEKYKAASWNLLFTDGSKSVGCIAFAATADCIYVIKSGEIFNFCSIFTAERKLHHLLPQSFSPKSRS